MDGNYSTGAAAFFSLIAALTACGSDTFPGTATSTSSGSVSGTGGATGPGGAAQGGGGAAGGSTSTASATGGATGGVGGLSTADDDGDGFSPADGDCEDTNALVNPNAFDVPGNTVDDDCNGSVDDAPASCDAGLAVDDVDPLDAAKAVELCKASTGPKSWGVVSAKWVLGDGSDPPAVGNQLANFHLGHGLLDQLGPAVTARAGARVVALSTGMARNQTDPGFQLSFAKGYKSPAPPGFPHPSPWCGNSVGFSENDVAALELEVRTPSNAEGVQFALNYFSQEWPSFACNDTFTAILAPSPSGIMDGHIAIDMAGNLVGNGTPLFDACSCTNGPPCDADGKTYGCAEGPSSLLGTEFEGHGATGWLRTVAPVDPNESITIRFVVGDTTDGILDSLVLVDDWQWLSDPMTTVVTNPI